MASHTFLYSQHQLLNAKMVEFSGYQMPVWYSSLKDEHLAVRRSAGMFDVSHMGVIILQGADTFRLLEKISCNDPEKSRNGKMVYSMALNEAGGILDDIMFGQIDERVLLVVNAGNKAKMLDWINRHLSGDVSVNPLGETHSLLAIQGPKAEALLAQALQIDLKTAGRFSVQARQWKGSEILISRTGYTGEDGFEIVVPNALAETLWTSALEAGVVPCGLAARDSLRIEAGLPLYGHELGESMTPFETRYKWVVNFNHPFIGAEALKPLSQQPPAWTTVGIEMVDRVIPRMGYPVKPAGRVLSGTLSPLTDLAVGMALVPNDHAEIGTRLAVEIRGQDKPAKVVAIPFY